MALPKKLQRLRDLERPAFRQRMSRARLRRVPSSSFPSLDLAEPESKRREASRMAFSGVGSMRAVGPFGQFPRLLSQVFGVVQRIGGLRSYCSLVYV